MGMGQGEQSTEFLTEVRQASPGIISVCNFHFKGAEWSGLEVSNGKPSRLYVDLNADGRLEPGESISPLMSDPKTTTFLTPDFYVTGDDRTQRLLRVLMIASIYDPNQSPSCMWQPASLLEGEVTLHGKAQKILLFAADLENRFDRFGLGGVALVNANEPVKGYVPRQTLSRMMNHDGTYYSLFVQPGDRDFNKAQMVFRPYNGDLGSMAVTLPDLSIPLQLRSLKIVGHEDPGIVMNIQGGQADLPVGQYRLQSGALGYGQDNTGDWSIQFNSTQAVSIHTDQTTTVSLGKPTLTIQAVDYNKRYNADEKPGTVFKQGTVIYVTRNLVGKTGEVFGRIIRNDQDNRYEYVKPHLTITDPAGHSLVSTDLEYG
jgi:hypothetical protein